MIGNIIGEEIDKYVADQIDFRQKIQGSGRDKTPGSIERNNKVLSYLNTRNTWAKLASGVGIEEEQGLKRVKDVVSLENYTTERPNTDTGDNETVNIEETNLDSLSGNSLAKSYVLFNTTQKLESDSSNQQNYINRSGVINNTKWGDSFNKTYGGMGFTDQGLTPVPGITDISIECVNRGSIKKAVVQLKAYNKFQFGIIELLYLRLGYTMLLEYGWDRYISGINDATQEVNIENVGDTVIEQTWFNDNEPNPDTILSSIEGNRAKYRGNYDGFFGKVYNFEWNLNPDMTYDITINLITIGSIITSLQAKPPSTFKQSQLKDLQIQVKAAEDGITQREATDAYYEDDNLPNVGNNEISIWLNKQKLDVTTGKVGSRGSGMSANKIGQAKIFWPDLIESSKLASEDRSVSNDYQVPTQYKKYTNNVLSKKEFENLGAKYFVRLKWFLEVFFKKTNTYILNKNGEPTPQLEWEGSTDNLICNYVPNLIPLDPTVCIFKPTFDEKVIENVFNVYGQKNTSTYENLSNNNMLYPYVVKDDGVFYGKILNLYMNIDFLLNILDTNINNKGEISVFQYLQNLCDGINRSMGGVTNLEPVIKSDKIVTIIEQNTPRGYDILKQKKETNKKIVDFEILGYNQDKSNFVKDFKFITKITPDLGNIISIGAAAADSDSNSIEALPFSKWNTGLTNIYQSRLTTDTSDNNLSPEEIEEEELKQNFLKNGRISKEGWNGTYLFYWRYKGRRYKITIPNVEVSDDDYDFYYWKGTSSKGYAKRNAEILEHYWKTYPELRQKVKNIADREALFEDVGLAGKQEASLNAYYTFLAQAFGGIEQKSESEITSYYEESYDGESDDFANASDYNRVNRVKTIEKKDAQFWNINQDFMSSGLSLFKKHLTNQYQTDYVQQEVVSNSVGFIPINLQMTVEGISGVKIYNKLNIDQRFLPNNYPNSLNFITMKVNHQISNNIWETNYECFSIPKSIKAPEGAKIGGSTGTISLLNEPTAGAPTVTIGEGKYSVIKPNTRSGLLYETVNPANGKTITKENKPIKNKVVLHHTAGTIGIKAQIKDWREREDTTAVSTHYLIDRQGNSEQVFDDMYWSQHLGTGASGDIIESQTIGIELISVGPLEKINNNLFKSTATGMVRSPEDWGGVSQTIDIGQFIEDGANDTDTREGFGPSYDWGAQNYYKSDYKGFQYWQSYTEAQLITLQNLLLKLYEKYPNMAKNLTVGNGNDIFQTKFGSFNRYRRGEAQTGFKRMIYDIFPYIEKVEVEGITLTEASYGNAPNAIAGMPGTYSHNSFKPNKNDVAPLPELIDCLKATAYRMRNIIGT